MPNRVDSDKKNIESLKELIKETDWNVLIILDACRFDRFEKIYGEYLKGSLTKCFSQATSTKEWLQGISELSFSDVVYISGHPWINSKGIEVLNDFNAVGHFHDVIDAWDCGWDDELETVPPSIVGKAPKGIKAISCLELEPEK